MVERANCRLDAYHRFANRMFATEGDMKPKIWHLCAAYGCALLLGVVPSLMRNDWLAAAGWAAFFPFELTAGVGLTAYGWLMDTLDHLIPCGDRIVYGPCAFFYACYGLLAWLAVRKQSWTLFYLFIGILVLNVIGSWRIQALSEGLKHWSP